MGDITISRLGSKSPPTVLLDEGLPGPLYGLPAIGVYTRTLAASPGFQAEVPALYHDVPRQRFELELLSLRALWNANLPIHTVLPAEVLLEIFKYSFVPYYHRDHNYSRWNRHPWATLMGICRHWCALIRNDTEFWRAIDVYENTLWLDLALRRSRRAPLRILLNSGHNVSAAVALLVQHADRLKHLDFRAVPTSGALQPLLDRPLRPILVGLAANGTPSITQIFADSHYPHLESLNLTYFSLVWTKSLVENLRSLTLIGCALSTGPVSLADFLDILEHGQQLHYLRLDSFLSASLSLQTSVPRERLAVLPNLSFLQCCDSSSYIARLLSHLQPAGACEFKLVAKCNDPDDASASYLSYLPQDGPRSSFMRFASSVYLHVSSGLSLVKWDFDFGGSCRLELHRSGGAVSDAWLERGLQQLPTVFAPGGKALKELRVMGKLHDVSPATLDHVFASFPALENLLLQADVWHGSSPHVFPANAIRSLSTPILTMTPREGTSEGPHVRCPTLKTLRIMMAYDWAWGTKSVDYILTCLDVRAAAGAPCLKHLFLVPSLALAAAATANSGESLEEYRQRLRERVEWLDDTNS